MCVVHPTRAKFILMAFQKDENQTIAQCQSWQSSASLSESRLPLRQEFRPLSPHTHHGQHGGHASGPTVVRSASLGQAVVADVANNHNRVSTAEHQRRLLISAGCELVIRTPRIKRAQRGYLVKIKPRWDSILVRIPTAISGRPSGRASNDGIQVSRMPCP